MLDISTLTVALHGKLVASATLQALGSTAANTERGTRINFDPSRCPWMGVYPGVVDTSPKLIGSRTWSDMAELMVVVQTASFSSDGTSASDLLESIIKTIEDVIVADLTLGIQGVRVLKLHREYRYVVFDDDGMGDLFMPQAIIRVSLEARSS